MEYTFFSLTGLRLPIPWKFLGRNLWSPECLGARGKAQIFPRCDSLRFCMSYCGPDWESVSLRDGQWEPHNKPVLRKCPTWRTKCLVWGEGWVGFRTWPLLEALPDSSIRHQVRLWETGSEYIPQYNQQDPEGSIAPCKSNTETQQVTTWQGTDQTSTFCLQFVRRTFSLSRASPRILKGFSVGLL